MRALLIACTILVAPVVRIAHAADAPEETVASSSEGIDLMQLLEMSAERLKKRFIVDPRVRGQVMLVNVDPRRITYAELQAILSVHGFVATQEIEGTVRIVPDANARQLPMPLLDQNSNSVGEEEIVTRTLDVGGLSAVSLVPLLRPLLPQYAHLVGHPETNALIVTARRGNVRMIEAIVQDLRGRPKRDIQE